MLLQLVSGGVPVSAAHEQLVRSTGLGQELARVKTESKGEDEPVEKDVSGAHHLWLFEVPVAKSGENKGKAAEGSCYYDKIPKAWKDKWKDREIERKDWRFKKPDRYDKGFQDFIDSHIPQFNNLAAYEPFYLYIEQARRWLRDKRTIADIPEGERSDWKRQELQRIADNKLYGLDKYCTIKEDGFAGGRRQFRSSAPHALVAFIVDMGNHFDLVKGRQAALTSMMMAIADLDMITIPSFTGVFMVHKKDGTGKTLFRDKHQSTLQHFPTWITREMDVSKGFSSESTIIDFDPGDTKATKGMDISEFRLLSAEDTMAVNGRTPTKSLLDEAQNIPTYQKVKAEIDPTLYQYNPDTQEMELVRAIYAWGTGSSNNTGQGAFENDFKGILEAWQGGEDTAGWVPLFFDWTCRPGMTRAFYEMQKAKYLRGQTEETKGLTPAERLSLFYAHYPSKPDDAFMSTHKTLVPMEMIVKQQQRIQELCIKKGFTPEVGRFEPIYNESIVLSGEIPCPGLKPHPITGARWVPSSPDDYEAPCKMMFPPIRNMANNCFQGTDPIANDGGFSRFSSAIWMASGKTEGDGDNIVHIPTVACMLNARTVFPHELFLQCALMGMYYANYGQRACKELVEINVGHRYTDFKCGPWLNLRDSLLTRHQLPQSYKKGQATNVYGIDLKGGKGSRKEDLYGDVTSLLRNYGHNIWYYDFWSQVRHIAVESKEDGSVQWRTQNKNVYNDDMVYAVAYAELCCRSMNKVPEHVSIDAPKYTTKRVVVRDSQMNPHYQYIQVPVAYA